MFSNNFSGYGAISALEKVIKRYRVKRVLLVTGKSAFALSGTKNAVFPFLKELDVRYFSDFDVNPKFEHAIAGALLAREFVPDIVVAIGGGSVIDMAKLINTFASKPNVEVDDVISNTLRTVAAPLVKSK